MMVMPYYLFFFVTLVSGTLLSLSSSSWLYVWVGLEINLMSFIPMMMASKSEVETESSLKYFLVQALGSGILLLGSFSIMGFPNSMISEYVGASVIVVSLMVKLGVAPFHFWVPHVMGGSSWISCMILSVWQKIAPLFLICSMVSFNMLYLYFIAGLSSLVGGFGGFNQTQARVLLAYSSVGHMGWMFAAMSVSYSVFMMYFLTYSLINLSLMSVLNYMSSKKLSMMSISENNMFYYFMVMMLFLSLAGLPPLLGFYPKWVVITSLMESGVVWVVFLLVMGALMNIFYYLNIFFNVMLKSYFSGVYYSSTDGVFMINVVLMMMFMLSTITIGVYYWFLI